jgi:hypothetical protein
MSSSCGSSSPLAQLLQSTSPQALAQAALKPKDPTDPKQLLSSQNSSDASAPASAAMAPGTGLLVDISA